jgi:hypothetical protein
MRHATGSGERRRRRRKRRRRRRRRKRKKGRERSCTNVHSPSRLVSAAALFFFFLGLSVVERASVGGRARERALD